MTFPLLLALLRFTGYGRQYSEGRLGWEVAMVGGGRWKVGVGVGWGGAAGVRVRGGAGVL